MSTRQVASELGMLAAGLVLGRLVLRKPPGPEPVVVRMGEPAPAPKPKRKRDFFTNNALGIAIISAVVSGTISFAVAHYQSQDSARQARGALQVQQAEQVQAEATALYGATNSVYNFQLECAQGNVSWRQCASLAPGFNTYANDGANFTADSLNITDHQAALLALNFSIAETQIVTSDSVKDAKSAWNYMLNLYLKLQDRFGQIIKGQT